MIQCATCNDKYLCGYRKGYSVQHAMINTYVAIEKDTVRNMQ